MHSARRELVSTRTAHPPIRGRSVRIGLARDASRLLRFYLRAVHSSAVQDCLRNKQPYHPAFPGSADAGPWRKKMQSAEPFT